jgi:hypothetical protein
MTAAEHAGEPPVVQEQGVGERGVCHPVDPGEFGHDVVELDDDFGVGRPAAGDGLEVDCGEPVAGVLAAAAPRRGHSPASASGAFVGDEQELAEVRWVDLAQADELMGGAMFEPVHSYLERILKAQDSK